MIVCLDSGNSRIKWGGHDGRCWLAQGAVAHPDVEQLAALVAAWPQPERVMLANVAGANAAAKIRQHLAAWAPLISEVAASERAAGVTNGYAQPQRLGVDRWCALIGARSLVDSAAVVVMAGTATTIDSLDAAGHFLGGLILPGVDLMLRSLARETAGLPFAAGQHQAWAWQRLAAADKSCLLSGGNAARLGELLRITHRQVDNLPLEGLRVIALQGA